MATARKKLTALTTGADYSVKGAGATSILTSLLGLCVVIPTPISLGLAGGIGILCCLAGTCMECKEPDSETELEHKIDDIEIKLDQALRRKRSSPQNGDTRPEPETKIATDVESSGCCSPCSIFYCKSRKQVGEANYAPPPPPRQTMDEGRPIR